MRTAMFLIVAGCCAWVAKAYEPRPVTFTGEMWQWAQETCVRNKGLRTLVITAKFTVTAYCRDGTKDVYSIANKVPR